MFLFYLVMCAYKLNNTESRFPHNPISQPNLLLLSIVMFGDHPITPPVLSLMFPCECLNAQSMSIAIILTKLNSLIGLRLACLLGILCTNEAINASIHLHASTSLPWMSPLLKIILSFLLAYFMGRV